MSTSSKLARVALLVAYWMGFAVAQEITVSLPSATMQQYDPLIVCVKITNTSTTESVFRFRRTFIIEQQDSNGEWVVVTPWPEPKPWSWDCDIDPRLAVVRTSRLPVGAVEYKVYWPLPSPAALVPGEYRIGKVSLESFEEGVVASSGYVPFTVVVHAANAAAVAPHIDEYERICAGDLGLGFGSATALKAIAVQWANDNSLSPGLRNWLRFALAEYHFSRRDHADSKTWAEQIPATSLPLPCGGLGQRARYQVIRADRLLSSTKAEFDLTSPAIASLIAEYPQMLATYGLATYSTRRDWLP